jgi:hypothetical protein
MGGSANPRGTLRITNTMKSRRIIHKMQTMTRTIVLCPAALGKEGPGLYAAPLPGLPKACRPRYPPGREGFLEWREWC